MNIHITVWMNEYSETSKYWRLMTVEYGIGIYKVKIAGKQ